MNIYFIVAGTSTYNVIDSLNHLKKNTLNIFSSPKIKKEQFSKLDDIGIWNRALSGQRHRWRQ